MTLYYNHWNIILFIATTLTFPYWPSPLATQSIALLLIIIIASYRVLFLRWARGILIALIVVSLHSYIFQSKIDNAFHAGKDITINVRVNSFFKKITRGNEYLVRFESINGDKIQFFTQPLIKIVVPESVILLLGERWQFSVRLQPVYGRLNEVGFDLERYYISQGWHAKGKLIELESAKRLTHSSSWRLMLYQKVAKLIEGLPNRSLLLALSFGDRNELTPETWQQLKNSGLVHLVAISGLHIGIAYLFGWKIGSLIRLIFVRWFSAPLVFALFTAASYSWLAGFSLSTLRALYMCGLFGFFSYIRLQYSPWSIVVFTMAILLLIDPFSILSASFWLTFISVSSIYVLLNTGLFHRGGWVKKAVFMQFALSIIMLPVTAIYFSGFSLTSCLYNLVFVPWFSFVVIPLVFVALIASFFMPSTAMNCWQLIDALLDPVSWSIPFAGQSWVTLDYHATWLVSITIVFFLFRPLLRSNLQPLMAFTLLLTGYSVTVEPKSAWQLSVLDVGHGLAVLVKKNGEHLLYDTGNRWQGGSMAESVIAPILRYRGADSLEGLIISHTDSDHAGGRSYIEQIFIPTLKYSSQSLTGYMPCIDKQTWLWNGLIFTAVWPPKIVKRAYNPHSCVLKISDGTSTVLLTGDIEAVGEILLSQQRPKIASDILLVPHHGSRTSSTERFLSAVNPRVAIASVSKGNQWGLPSVDVVTRYKQKGIQWLDTGQSGQVSIDFSKSGWSITTERDRQSLHWYRQKLRNGVE